ncbi:MAG: hypothetical protein U1E93_00790 [Alphaproteobacteria bacterium]
MTTILKRAGLTIGLSLLSLTSLAVMTAPAAAHVVCDWDGDDCYRTGPHYDRYDDDWRRDWHDREEWRERREAERRWYWRHRYYDDYRPTGGTSMWFNF